LFRPSNLIVPNSLNVSQIAKISKEIKISETRTKN